MKYSKLFPILMFLVVLSLFAMGQVFFIDQQGSTFIYKNITKEYPVYSVRDKIDNICQPYEICTNKSISLNKDDCTYKFECRDIITKERYISGYESRVVDTVKIGERYKDTNYYGDVHIKDNVLSVWIIPIGDRNYKEYPQCLEYEKQKGVCNDKKV
jgi:hypothetical protein